MIQLILMSSTRVGTKPPISLVRLHNNSESKSSHNIPFRYMIYSISSLAVIGTVSHHLHKTRKDALGAFFSKRSVMRSADSIQSCVDRLCGRLEEYCLSQRSINLRVIFGALSMDVISVFGYGRSYNSLEKSDFDHELYQLMSSGGELALLLKQCPWIFQIANLLPYSFVARFDPKIMLAVKRKEVGRNL